MHEGRESHSTSVLKDVTVAMRDRTRLATDVYAPAPGPGRPARWPTLFGRTSYDQEADWPWIKTAKLIDVYPPGADYVQGCAMNLADGIVRARHRNGYERAEFMTPGDVSEVRIELGPTSHRVRAGRRIRVDISSSNFPRLDVNPSTGERLGLHTHAVAARKTMYAGARRPSHVVLSVIPPDRPAP